MGAIMRTLTLLLFSALIVLAAAPSLHADPLITEEEAAMPTSPDVGLTTRGITRGPSIEQVSPAPDAKIKSPIALVVKIGARNDATIDKDSVKLTYIRGKNVDVTSRIKPFITADGIEMKKADVPAGNHVLRLDVKDSQGRSTTTMIKLSVEK